MSSCVERGEGVREESEERPYADGSNESRRVYAPLREALDVYKRQ